jgi:integrase
VDFRYKRPVITPCQIDKNLIPDESKQINVLIQMKNDNKSEDTIGFTRKALRLLSRHACLSEPESVKAFIAQMKGTSSYKRNLCIAYNKYCNHFGINCIMPHYRKEEKNIAFPTKEKLLMLLANAGNLLSLKLSLSMETGLRPVELCRLKVKGIDIDHKTVNPTTAKRGKARTVPISETLTTKLRIHISTKKLLPIDQLFKGVTAVSYSRQYRQNAK